MAYSTISKPSLHFNTKLYTGNGGTNAQTGVGFQPDWLWIKGRSNANWHWLTDSVRGNTKNIFTNSTQAEGTNADGITAFGTDGFTVGSNTDVNGNGNTFVSWNWKAGGAGSTNTDGSINSTVSVNTTAGFSVVKYTGNGSDQTVGHGLGVAPSMIIVKCLTATHDWVVYHQRMGNGKAIGLNSTSAEYSATGWQNTSPTNQVFYIKGGANSVSQSGDFVAYCFAEKKGYSKFGSYKGNGSAEGSFIYTGFKPAFIMTKRNDGSSDWLICDNTRDTDNGVFKKLFPNTNGTEDSYISFDFVSNGVKIRSDGNGHNANNAAFIYMAVAEEPLVANVGASIPATAR